MINGGLNSGAKNGLIPSRKEGIRLLDNFGGAACAYSLRLLSLQYNGNCIRVRRSSDNAESDIGFVWNNISKEYIIDTYALLSFVGTGNGFVTTWYDQSGNKNDAYQTTAAQQPQIVISGRLNTENKLPCINFISTSSLFFNLRFTVSGLATSNWSSFMVQKRTIAGRLGITFANNAYGLATAIINSDNSIYIINRSIYKSVSHNVTDQRLFSSFNIPNGGNGAMTLYSNGLGLTLGADTAFGNAADFSTLGKYGPTYANGTCQEAIMYQLNHSTNRLNIELNINIYYGIY